MKRITILVIILCSSVFSFSQNDTINYNKKKTNRYVIWLIPSTANNIYGFAIGPIGSEAICNRPYTKYSYGINLQIIGQGIFQTFYISKFKFKDFKEFIHKDSTNSNNPAPIRAMHNGLIFSPFGTFTEQINGISFSLWMSMGQKVNGISFNLLWNLYGQVNGISIGLVNHANITKGVQIGLFNNSKILKGFQFGLWNKNEKRSLPIMNWQFKSAAHNECAKCQPGQTKNCTQAGHF